MMVLKKSPLTRTRNMSSKRLCPSSNAHSEKTRALKSLDLLLQVLHDLTAKLCSNGFCLPSRTQDFPAELPEMLLEVAALATTMQANNKTMRRFWAIPWKPGHPHGFPTSAPSASSPGSTQSQGSSLSLLMPWPCFAPPRRVPLACQSPAVTTHIVIPRRQLLFSHGFFSSPRVLRSMQTCWRDVAPASCILIQLCTHSPWALQRIRGNLVAMAACFRWHAGTEAGLRGTNLRPQSNKKEDRKASLSADAADEQPVAWPPPRLFSSPMRAAARETNASWQAAAFLCLFALRDFRFCSALSVAPRFQSPARLLDSTRYERARACLANFVAFQATVRPKGSPGSAPTCFAQGARFGREKCSKVSTCWSLSQAPGFHRSAWCFFAPSLRNRIFQGL